MLNSVNILSLIKTQVQVVLPDSKVMLFGSRVHGNHTDESDWDILVMTKDKHSKAVKRLIQDQVFPISLEFSTFINLILVQEEEWKTNPGYYSLRKNIGNNLILA